MKNKNYPILALLFLIITSIISCGLPGPEVVDETLAWNHHGIGTNHVVAINSIGANSTDLRYNLYTWGDNSDGQLGYPSNGQLKATLVNKDEDWSLAFARKNSSMAIKLDGSLWAWGYNGQGQLGNGTTTNIATPTKVDIGPWKTVAMGDSFTIGIKKDGTLWSWGINTQGQLGNNSYNSSLIPKKISNNSNWTQAAAGWAHALAINQSGMLYGWGRNTESQYGNSNGVNSLIPIITTDLLCKKVAAGKMHSVAILTNGTMWATGSNSVGQLGIGSAQTTAATFVQIGNSNDWGSVEAGPNHNIAFKVIGNVSFWTWGENTSGQLGTNDLVNKTVPTLILNDDLLSARTSENNISVLYRYSGGHIYTAGNNAKGQIGNGNTTNYKVFTRAYF